MIHVALFPADQYGCGHYRMRLPAAHSGCVVDEYDRVELRTSEDLRRGVVRLHRVKVGGADVAVFQRPTDHRLIPTIEQLQKQGVACVVEIDDDLTAIDPTHASYQATQPSTSPNSNWRHAVEAARIADLVTVTTPALARRFAPHGRVVVLPNCVPGALLTYVGEKRHDLGWTGLVKTHPRDLRVLGGAIAKLVREGHDFAVVGDQDGVCRALGIEDCWSSGWVDEIDHYYRLMAGFHVGIVPLADTPFNDAKSALKGVEFAALGVPFVASPSSAYVDLQARGAGMIADRPKRWNGYLRTLLRSGSMREELAEAGRETVRRGFTIEREGWRWAEAWETAVENRARAGAPVLA